jgi:hypothetical protein
MNQRVSETPQIRHQCVAVEEITLDFDISSVSDTADAAIKISLTLIRAAIKINIMKCWV